MLGKSTDPSMKVSDWISEVKRPGSSPDSRPGSIAVHLWAMSLMLLALVSFSVKFERSNFYFSGTLGPRGLCFISRDSSDPVRGLEVETCIIIQNSGCFAERGSGTEPEGNTAPGYSHLT